MADEEEERAEEVTRLVDPSVVPEVQTEENSSAAFHPQEATTVDGDTTIRSSGTPVQEPGPVPDTVQPASAQPEVAEEPVVFVTTSPESAPAPISDGLAGLPSKSEEVQEQTPHAE